MDNFPAIPQPLLRALEKHFPERSPSKDETYADLMFRAGEGNVIRFLKRVFEEQNHNLLDRKIT